MAATGATAIGINIVAAEQYLAIVLTGNIYKQDFEERGIAPQSLSRQIEDTATVTSVLVPWNSCGAYAAGVLNVATAAYLPFAFFNWINPLVSFFYDLMGWQIHRVPVDTPFPPTPSDVEFYGVEGHNPTRCRPTAGSRRRPRPTALRPSCGVLGLGRGVGLQHLQRHVLVGDPGRQGCGGVQRHGLEEQHEQDTDGRRQAPYWAWPR